MNWGKGLVIGMLLFMSFIVGMSCYMFKLPADDYDREYYEKGLTFNSDFKKERQVIIDKAQPLMSVNAENIMIRFTAPATGTVRFIDPASQNRDKIYRVETNGDVSMALPKGGLTNGKWNVTINWKSGAHQYLYKQDINIHGQ
ncbi:hypothetical protein DYU05_06905 [Mucilaginibacter terrenus]|uniref:Nitrogen fixation protein FixH n=1 Tax=Mucilaginibacter terrenus TaxID=2482727 RepID=A0A3E2NWH5_9SPHI|nr:FixH family protein [Mucilaginibacter terrenus]RFZ85319.1 hypothetical protein DYU05_06905 [Mucilaginibacter terrenus]